MTDKNPVDLDHLDALCRMAGGVVCTTSAESFKLLLADEREFVVAVLDAYPAMAEELRRLRALFVLVANCALQMELALEDDLPFKAAGIRDQMKALLVDHAPPEVLNQLQADMRWKAWKSSLHGLKVEALQHENDTLRARVAELEGK